MCTEEFFDLVAQRLADDGSEVSRGTVAGLDSVVGYRSQFRIKWFATKLHTFTVVACVDSVDAASLERFSNSCIDYGLEQKGRFRGLQSGAGVVAVLASTSMDESAVTQAGSKIYRRYSAFAWPAVFDLNTVQFYRHEGSVQRAHPDLAHPPGSGERSSVI